MTQTVHDPDARPEVCADPDHIDGCPGRAGGDHEVDPHQAHIRAGASDNDCRDCERTWEHWNLVGPW